MSSIKKIIGLSLLGITVTSLTGCNLIINQTDSTIKTSEKIVDPTIFHAKFTGKTEISKDIKVNYKDGDFDKIKKTMTEASDILESNTNYNAFEVKYKDVLSFIENILLDYNSVFAKYSVYGTEELQKEYLSYYDYYLEAYEWYDKIRHDIVKSNFKNLFYGKMTDEEIYDLIGKEKTEKYYELNKKIEKIKSDQLALSDYELESKTPSMYIEFVKYQNELAKEEGYDNYMEYAYNDIYYRDYKYEDTDEFFNNFIKYIWESYKDDSDEISSRISSIRRSKDFDVFVRIFEDDGFISNMNYFDDYAYYMNDSFYKAYKHLWNDGYYYISYEDDSYDGAYTDYYHKLDEPYVYYGSEYHDLFTIVHEFGHYFAYTLYSDETSYDIAETQSQGNELLFLEYLLKNNNFSDNLVDIMRMYRNVNDYNTILTGILVNEFEKEVYLKENLKSSDFNEIINKIYNKLDGKATKNYIDLGKYWKYVAIQNPGYYISYATSLTAAKELEALAKSDLDKAKEAYFKICNADFDNMIFIDVLEQAGLKNPFSEDAFKAIVA